MATKFATNDASNPDYSGPPADKDFFSSIQTDLLDSSEWIFRRRFKQFRASLLALCDEVRECPSANAERNDFEGLCRNIKDVMTWADAFKYEQSLVQFMCVDAIIAELRRRRTDIDKLSPALKAHYQYELKNALQDDETTEEAQRKLLLRLVKDQQHCELNDYHRHFFINSATQRVNVLFLFGLLAFLIIVLNAMVFATYQPNYALMSLVSGIFGASFSMLVSLEIRVKSSDVDELRAIRSWASLATRLCSGAAGGLLLYFFLMSNIVTISGLEHQSLLLESGFNEEQKTSYALFILLTFTAGFVEKLVPGLINNTGKNLNWKDKEKSQLTS